MPRKTFLSFVLPLLLIPACSCGDGGGEPMLDDGGDRIDGAPRVDTGTPADTGTPGTDTGTPGADMGTPGTDADTPGMDASGPLDDAATPGVDTGPGPGCTPACTAGFTCTAAGYCASPAGVPAFDHVYVAIFENHSRASVITHAPYIDSLAAMGASATRYTAITHPSLPNYIAMVSGDFWGDACDCRPGATHDCNPITCNVILRSCSCEHDQAHLGDQLDTLSVPWREYGEGMGSPCSVTDVSARHYAAKHMPFLYFSNVLANSARCTMRVRDYGDFAADLGAGTYRFSMITPDLCNDMHDACGGDAVAHGDAWAAANLAPILLTPGFAAGGRDALFVVWDEEDASVTPQPLPFIVVSPLARAGATTDHAYDHYSLLATWQEAFGAPRLAHSATATPINDIWR